MIKPNIKSAFYCLNEHIKYDVIIKSYIPASIIQNSFGYNSLNVFPCITNLNNGYINLLKIAN